MTKADLAVAAYGTARRTLPPLHVVVELYDLARISVAHAVVERRKGDHEREFLAMSKAAQILQGLGACVGPADKRTRAVTGTLRAYYRQTLLQLHAAKRAGGHDGLKRYASVCRQILTMRETWAELAGMPALEDRDGQSLPGARPSGQSLPSDRQNMSSDWSG